MGNIQAGNGEILNAVARAQTAMSGNNVQVAAARETASEPLYFTDQPWLITTVSQMREQEEKLNFIRESCQEKFSASLSYADKLKWAEINTRKFKNDQDYVYINVTPVLQQIMNNECSHDVKVIVLVNKSQTLKKLKNININQIGEGVLRTDFKASSFNGNYLEYVEESTSTLKSGNYTTIFEIEMTKDKTFEEVLERINPKAIEMKESNHTIEINPMKLNPNLLTTVNKNVNKIGELPYSLENGKGSFIVEINVVSKKQILGLEPHKESKNNKPGKSYILVKNCESKDYLLWIDGHYDICLRQIRDHIFSGNKECDYIRHNIESFRLDLYEAHLVYLMKNPFHLTKIKVFSELLAMSAVLISDDTFFKELQALVDEGEDADDQLEGYEEFLEDFAQFWQTISRLPDDILEIDIELVKKPNILCDNDDRKNIHTVDMSDSLLPKNVLHSYLKFVAWEIERKGGVKVDLSGSKSQEDESMKSSVKRKASDELEDMVKRKKKNDPQDRADGVVVNDQKISVGKDVGNSDMVGHKS